MRFYFYDENGKELDTPLNGARFSGSGSWCQSTEGNWVEGYRHELQIFVGRGYDNVRTITLDDFPGRDQVRVKHWWPKVDPEMVEGAMAETEWFWLCKKDRFIEKRNLTQDELQEITDLALQTATSRLETGDQEEFESLLAGVRSFIEKQHPDIPDVALYEFDRRYHAVWDEISNAIGRIA